MQNITRISPPQFRVGKYTLNVYELRTLMIEVAKGEREPGIRVKDKLGNVAIILPNGSPDNHLSGLSLESDLKFELLKQQIKIQAPRV